MIIDGKNAVLGRLSTSVAKELTKGEEVTILNAEKIIITGRKDQILAKYLKRRGDGSSEHGPFFPRAPDKIVRRAVRGMLSYKTKKGRASLKKLSVVVGKPDSYNDKEIKKEERPIKTSFLRIEDLAKSLGWNNG
jgi:large subunit ribosomal protein L13